jgi:hypothetical protein
MYLQFGTFCNVKKYDMKLITLEIFFLIPNCRWIITFLMQATHLKPVPECTGGCAGGYKMAYYIKIIQPNINLQTNKTNSMV